MLALSRLQSITILRCSIIRKENMIICKLRTWSRSEKIGVKFQARVSKELFGLIEDIELMELPLQGRKFTWNNAVSAAKLDRFLFTIDWD
jgi:hypothetical protein